MRRVNLLATRRRAPVRTPRNTHVITRRRDTTKGKKRKDKQKQIRGKEVSVRSSASEAQIIYGRMRVGGIYSFIETSADAKASLQSGSNNNQIVWIAKTGGSSGNAITVRLVVSGTVGSTTSNTVGTDITVTCKSTAGVSQAIADDVISAVRADSTANALVTVSRGSGNGQGLVSALAQTNLANGGGTVLHQVITLAGHKIDAMEKLYLDEREVTFGGTPDARWAIGIFADKVFMALNSGDDNQEAQPDLVAQLPAKWTVDHRQRGCAHIYLITRWNETLFSQGMPDVSLLVRGKPVYDPRNGQTVWSQNAALIIADYLVNTKWGPGIPYSDIDEPALIDAANTCDESVSLLGGGTEPRYQINGVLDASQSPQDVLEEMAEAIAGDIIYQGGKWVILPGKWRAPTITLTEADARGPIKVEARASRKDNFNSVRGTYSSAAHNYQEVDFPAVKVSSYVTEDGREIYEDLALNLVISSGQAQRIARIRLGQVRQPIKVSYPASLTALRLQVGDTVNLTLSRYGWGAKTFEVRDFRLAEDLEVGPVIDLVLKETAQAIYTWLTEYELAVDPAPNSNLPDPNNVEPPTALVLASGTSELYTREDGTVFTRLKVAWIESVNVYVQSGGRYEIQYKKSADSDWSNTTPVPAGSTFVHILDVQDGISYDVRVRAVTPLGALSSWLTSTGHTVVGKTAPPADVGGLGAAVDSFGIALAWADVPDQDLAFYEIRLGSNWASSSFLQNIKGTAFRLDTKVAGTYDFLVKAVDTSGNYSVNEAKVTSIIVGPAAPIVTPEISGPDMLMTWTVPDSNFSIDAYELSYGTTYSGSTNVASVKGTSFKVRVDWGGSRRFWVAARDVAGNGGAAAQVDVIIDAPSVPLSLDAKVVDNNVLLSWQAPSTHSLPIDYYSIKRGDALGAAAEIGRVSGTFSTYIETTGGTFKYWIEPYDTAGNVGIATSVSAIVSDPPDYQILAEQSLFAADFTRVSMIEQDGALIGPAFPFESWDEHFVRNLWDQPQDQIDAGYLRYIEPSPSACYAYKVTDFGTLLPAGIIKVDYAKTDFVGTPSVVVKIAHSTDGTTWTELIGPEIYAAVSFRYVRIRFELGTFTGVAGSPMGLLLGITNP